MFLLTSIYAVYNEHYTLSIAPFIIGLTSINYWRYPIRSYRRKIDLVAVKSMILYQTCMIQNAQYKTIYISILLVGVVLYIYGYYQYYYNQKKRLSLYAHCMVHILGNIGCIILYSGSITTIL
jgi:hypothetical protein